MGKLLTILSIVAFICGNLFAQTGPGGVGNSANNELWLKADNITGLSNGDNVSTWQDASGNSNDAIQGGAYRPVYKVNTINGKPVVRFDGSNDYYDNVFAPQSSNMTIYTVFAHDHNGTSAPDGPLWQPDQSSGTSGFLPMFSNNNQYIYYGDGWLNKISEFSQATWYSSIARYGTGSTELWKDGVLNDDTLFNTITIDSFQIGRRNIGQLNYYKGDIAELIVYNTDINDAQLIIVDNYLAAKYGITIADDKYIFQALYGNEVAGIGREDASNYHTAAQSAGIMKISSPDNLGDGEYLIFGHDNADITTWTTTDAPNSGVNIRRISSEWQFDETGNVGTVTIELDNTLLPALPAGYTTYYVLQDADGVFANGAVLYPMTASGANTYEATGIDIADGDYITFAVVRPVIQFTITSSSEFEPDGPVPVQVSLNYPMGTDVTADISISGSTAIGGGVDYSLSAGIVTITAGNTTANIFISLTNDILVESSETIILYLANPSAGVVLGVNTQHTVTINDDDNPRNINFTAAGSSNNEGVTPVTVTVQINNVDAVNPTTVDYNVIGGTATGGGIDYNLADGTATVLPGDLTTIFDIFVDEDILDENDETIIITLANPQNCNLATTNTTYTYTIIDNDSQPTVQFTDSASSGSEAVSPGTIEVSLSYISGIDVTVDYTVADGTASGNGVDYTLSGGTLTIPAGNTNGYLNPVIVEDSYTEGNESFTVTLSNPVFAALGATTINTYTIIDDEMFSIVLSYTDVLCYGENTGTATAIPMGGAPPYTFLWDDDMNTTDSIVTGLYANIWYHVTVTDDSSNTLVDSFILSQPDSLWAEINGTDIICHGSTEGSVTVTATGGTTPYFYNWSPDGFTGDSTDTYSNLSANTYSVTVADANFCCDTAGFIINDAAQIIFNINATDATCSNCDGSATANAVNGTPPYVFLWSNGNTLQSIDSLCAGNYSLQITDSAGCTFDTTFSVSNTSELTASLTSITNVTCNGDNTGVAVVTPSGGILPVTYLWSNGQTESVATGLSAGVYNVTVTDDAGCSYMVNATITEPDILTITLNTADVSCNQTNDGSITVNAFGGVGNYQYSIDTGATWVFQNTFTGLFPGNYLVVVRDSIGCQVTDSAVIDSSSYLTISAYVTNTTCGWYSGSIFLNITGGSPPYSYQWHPGSWWWGSYHNHLSTGYYNITVTDDNGCTNDTIIFVGDDCPPNLITGYVFDDMNANCIKDSTDFGLSGWMVRADPGPVYAYTNNTGYYYMYLDSGNYTISLVDNDPIRQQVCPVSPSTYNLSLDALPDTVGGIDFSVHADEYCPDLNVDIRVWGISPCRNNSFYVFYCNNGTSPASAIVEVELDNNMSLTSYYPYSYYVDLISQLGNILTFDVGTLFPEQCGHFKIRAYLECDMSLVGNTKCVTAHIYPDSSCFPADTVWDKSSVAVEGNCVDDSLACFTVYNTGDPGEGDMDGESEYRIYENNTLVYTGTFQIPGGDSLIVCRTACGNTIRLEADQRPDHPGNSHPQDNVEMCGDSDDTFVTGQITVVPEDDEDDFISIDCQVVVASYDPNDKQVMPEGLTEQFHFIDSTYTLEYTVHFQNTGTDTAFKVVIRDTLSPYLDITTIELGTSSHDYTFEIFEGNILQWTFDSIILPDSNVNEPESHGFVKFGIHQKSGNEIGTVIENKADIVFDYNEPVMTNTVFNTVGSIDSIVVNNPITFYDNISVKVYPNPFHLTTTFEIHGINRGESFSFELYNILGKQVSSISGIKEEKFVVDRENLPTGIYIYKIFTQNGMVSAGRLLVI